LKKGELKEKRSTRKEENQNHCTVKYVSKNEGYSGSRRRAGEAESVEGAFSGGWTCTREKIQGQGRKKIQSRTTDSSCATSIYEPKSSGERLLVRKDLGRVGGGEEEDGRR